MPDPVESLFEVHKDMIKFLLVLGIFLAKYSEVKDLLYGASSLSETCLFLCNDIFSIRSQSMQNYF